MQKLLTWMDRVLFPQEVSCHRCDAWTERGILCRQCQSELDGSRLKNPLVFARKPLAGSISVWRHEAAARKLVHALKYNADGSAASLLGEGMAYALGCCPQVLERIDAVVPVPLHAARLRERGFNQALLLARAVCSHTRLQIEDGWLVRSRNTGRQVGRSRDERMRVMQGAFEAPQPDMVKGKRILLVDDVLTTGATAAACARTLYRAGAAEVYLLTACRA